ncbi:MAG: molybdopterin-binding protein [Pseudomonadota bacterium]
MSASETTATANGGIVTAAVIIIGNEILSGRTQDTNLNHIALTLGGWGIRVQEARVIADDEAAIIECVNLLRAEHDYVFTTGGIGPTHDDITAACIAKAFGVSLVEHPEIAALIRSREAPPDVMRSRLRMAMVPEGAGLVANATGGPPGFYIDNVYVMAGIPRVMQAMLAGLDGKLRGGAIVKGRSVSAYIAESEIADGLSAVQDAYADLSLGSYPFMRDGRYGTNLVVRGTQPERIDAALDAVCDAIRAAGAEPMDIADA